MRDGSLLGWFAVELTPAELDFSGHIKGDDAAGQQTWEALAILVGLRLWAS